MEIEQAKPGSVAARKGLGLADKQITALKSRFLPFEPHLLNVSTEDPLRESYYYHEYEKLPFEPNEVKQLQYMTMISDGDRGVASAKGDWHDEIYNQSPRSMDARSSTTTPNPARELKKVANKMSFSDYKNLKEKGIKPSPRPVAANIERNPGHSRNTSAVTAGTPMSRISSFEGPVQVKQNGASASTNLSSVEKVPSKETESQSRPVAAHKSAGPQEKPRATTNGHVEPANNSLHVKDANRNSQSQKPKQAQTNNGQKHGLPPRPQSPPRRNLDIKQLAEPKQQKRPLEISDVSQPEKRTKIEHSRTPSNPLPRKPETPTGKLLPGKPSKPQHSSPPPKKEMPTNKPNHGSKPPSEKPLDLPPLLSPLPADLDSSPTIKYQPSSSFPNTKRSESGKDSSQSTPSKFKVGSDTIVVKKPPQIDSSPLSPPPKSPLSSLPPLLSPTLPSIVEEELVRLQQKSAEKAEKSALNTAEARYEKARQPDTPGVARKMVTPKVGHPPKKSQAESSKPKASIERMDTGYIVKLKYKKRRTREIQRILHLTPRPDKAFLQLERERLSGNKESAAKAVDSDEDEDDVPLSKVTSKSTTASTVSKKRSSESVDLRSSEPAPKRTKIPDTIDVSKSRAPLDAPFKSPALTGPSQKTLLSTPKKGDVLKSVTMRRVDSNDGLSRTPQASNSTPASAEKPRVNGDVRSNPEHDRLRTDERRLSDTALKLKRKMDELLKTKGGNREAITDEEKKLGLCYGVESLVTYMNAWVTQEKISKHPSGKNWVDGVRLWEFVDAQAKHFPVLAALCAQVGALFREEVNKIYVDALREKKDSATYVTDLQTNSKGRDRCWYNAQKGRVTLSELGIKELMGPWSGAGEAMAYAVDILERYSRREKLGWKKDGGV